jgi:regulator of replication initiation timing
MADSTARLEKLTDGQNAINRQLAEAQAVIERLKRENTDLQAERTALTARLTQPAPAVVATAAAGSGEEVARLKEQLAREQSKVEMTVRSFALAQQENERLKAQLEKSGAEHPAENAKAATP